jgi:hypothetical protein
LLKGLSFMILLGRDKMKFRLSDTLSEIFTPRSFL